ncbi:thiamine phosphate synthase [Bacteroides oleiciplenus]|uniref:Thiamine-phosphate synthase n=1 Tax=Bacteroides oleiciplenus YIT 12058 TaxID=742727 RepID=K9ELI9_9BACE|nr:thiamine phosphate synthase [Bacteroides oleiciplenus]EKU90015.1 thiamine-phosphate pyrophosphorylase [Bacteroides oleiciplenus YIT 12058]
MFDVQFITHFTASISYLDSARIALEGGCRWVQLRMKDASEDELKATAIRVQDLCRQYRATFIIDDHVDLVKQIGADGVHLGKLDMPIKEARERLGKGFIIGGTANTFEDIRQHVADGADYIGCGPFRFTTTKQKLSPILGLDGYRSILTRMKEESLSIPVVGIGGITREDIPALKAVGLSGIALSGGILKAGDPVREMETIIQQTE